MHSSEAQTRKHPQRLPFIYGFKCKKYAPHFKNITLLLASHSIPFSAFHHHPPLQQAQWFEGEQEAVQAFGLRGEEAGPE